MAQLITGEVATLLREIFIIIEQRADDWVNVIPEALVLKNQCSVVDAILPHIDTGLDEDSLQYRCMATIKTILESARDEIEEFIRRDTKERHLLGKVFWNSKRVFLATWYRESFKNKSDALAESIRDITMYMNLGDCFRKVTVDHVKDLLSPASYEFWMKHVGSNVSDNNAWAIFIQQYQIIYGRLSEDMIESIRRVACVNGTDLTVYGFIRITKEYGFPIDVDRLPPLPLSNVVMSEEGRMEIAKMVMSLMSDFSSKEMHQSFIRVELWYKGVNREDKDALQKRADEWAECIVASRNAEHKTELHLAVEELDYSRKTISLFYQRYMVIWRIGRVSREMLSDVDFPGKARIRSFLRYIYPLDYANYRIVIRQDPAKWDHRSPKVYKFLKELL
ncbi:hypothetical protein EC973_001194 [Apophysomyces ossiformis]|uniref:Uncharacterized protein n=1 Tax=Apophysomyces ossiformis TaxID=679940 RepID=A0A8H7BK53_9FUNG|nr:hypothetical protein EC973_001194 [Apophysomyces ossiformis]